MKEKRNYPVVISLYLGSGERGAQILKNLKKQIDGPRGSLSDLIVKMIKKASPETFRGVENVQ